MCGIYAVISQSSPSPIEPSFARRLCSRGPDHIGTVHAKLGQKDCPLSLSFTSTVLSLRGDHIAKQPLVDERTGSILCWNGEAWRIRGQPLSGSDTEAILALLLDASFCKEFQASEDPVLDALRTIEGPFAFIYFDKPSNRLYYGRDRLGRRSLLMNPGSSFVLSSIAESSSEGWVEVEADGCYTIQLGQVGGSVASLRSLRCPWDHDDSLVSSIGVFNAKTPWACLKLSCESQSVSKLRHYLTESLCLRILDVPVPPAAIDSDSKVAVLFSGGLDCTVLARLASDILPPSQPIDLINVAFENPRIASQHKACSQEELYELCPDRITGRKSFAELTKTCPDRSWRFVTVNVTYAETCAHRGEIISLIHPHNTEMDLSIGNALYFAARGQGTAILTGQSEPRSYAITARVLLSGLGADELFGGYLRHRTAFSRRGYPGLIDELKLDISRLGKRNLGRDDRVMAQWGREVRFPFLDESLVKWAIELPAWEKCDFDNQGTDDYLDPEKRVLRLLAENLGMPHVAREKKRAIQFGARTAKMESGRVKGTTSIIL